ncbi:MAG TPA: hypothetical protein VJG83_03240 [archaeon]|nr:hypothetical protein [archaeon]
MGRTVPSFRQVIEAEYVSLEKFKAALRKQDREILERLLYKARLHTQAGGYAEILDPMHVILISMMIEIEKKMK